MFLHKGSGTPQDKREAAHEWRLHLSGQYHDRLIYWHMRWFSRLRVHGVLCIIVDSMDKAKVAWPQYRLRKRAWIDWLAPAWLSHARGLMVSVATFMLRTTRSHLTVLLLSARKSYSQCSMHMRVADVPTGSSQSTWLSSLTIRPVRPRW